MKTVKTPLTLLKCNYPFQTFADLDRTIFIDIETTGLSSKTSSLYLIGCIYRQQDSFQLIQWFADAYVEEEELLRAFFQFCKGFNHMVHFNGNSFDIPYLQQKAAQYGLEDGFSGFGATDLYRRISPCKHFLKLPDCKQKTLETFLNVNREDVYQGGELISIYHDYVKNREAGLLHSLLLHNAEDIQGLVALLPLLSYCDLFTEDLRVTKVQANYYRDHQGERKQEIHMKLHLPSPLPVTISQGICGCYFMGKQQEGTLKVPLYETELKYFYANYKDYYYLPAEDIALHKSVSHFVDRENRMKATAATCYTRKQSIYLPQWEVLFQPFFKKNYSSKELYFELTDELKQERTSFSRYALHVLEMMVKNA